MLQSKKCGTSGTPNLVKYPRRISRDSAILWEITMSISVRDSQKTSFTMVNPAVFCRTPNGETRCTKLYSAEIVDAAFTKGRCQTSSIPKMYFHDHFASVLFILTCCPQRQVPTHNATRRSKTYLRPSGPRSWSELYTAPIIKHNHT